MEQDHTKEKQNITRINFTKMFEILEKYEKDDVKVLIERPLKNPKMFKATCSGMRAFEIQLTLIKDIFKFSVEVIPSTTWQKKLLPVGTKGTAALKKASKEVGKRLYPQFSELIDKHGDADGLLMAEFCKRLYLF